MGILLHPYNPAVYNRLPHFELATKQAADVGVTSKLDQLGQIFVKHDTFRLFGLIIIHRHFDMTNKEILVDSLAEDKLSSIAMPWNLNGNRAHPSDEALWRKYKVGNNGNFIHPMTWTFTAAGEIEAFEFQNGEKEVEEMPGKVFLEDLFRELKSLGLEKVIGLRRYNPKSWESTPRGLRANILHFTEVPQEILPEMITVMWTFNENGKCVVNGTCVGHQCCGHGGGCGCHR